MNSIPFQGHWDLDAVWRWFESEDSLHVAIVTGAGDKAFCAGQDLLEVRQFKTRPPAQPYLQGHPPSGFAGLSQRKGKKPIIAAVNGYAFGGGFEICLNW
jgi:enoyl-CoA hydratase/carnithine racemase